MIQGMSQNKKDFVAKEVGEPLLSAVEKALDARWQRLEDAGLARKELRFLSKGGHVSLDGADPVRGLRKIEEDLAAGVTSIMGADWSKAECRQHLKELVADILKELDPAAPYLMDLGVK